MDTYLPQDMVIRVHKELSLTRKDMDIFDEHLNNMLLDNKPRYLSFDGLDHKLMEKLCKFEFVCTEIAYFKWNDILMQKELDIKDTKGFIAMKKKISNQFNRLSSKVYAKTKQATLNNGWKKGEINEKDWQFMSMNRVRKSIVGLTNKRKNNRYARCDLKNEKIGWQDLWYYKENDLFKKIKEVTAPFGDDQELNAVSCKMYGDCNISGPKLTPFSLPRFHVGLDGLMIIILYDPECKQDIEKYMKQLSVQNEDDMNNATHDFISDEIICDPLDLERKGIYGRWCILKPGKVVLIPQNFLYMHITISKFSMDISFSKGKLCLVNLNKILTNIKQDDNGDNDGFIEKMSEYEQLLCDAEGKSEMLRLDNGKLEDNDSVNDEDDGIMADFEMDTVDEDNEEFGKQIAVNKMDVDNDAESVNMTENEDDDDAKMIQKEDLQRTERELNDERMVDAQMMNSENTEERKLIATMHKDVKMNVEGKKEEVEMAIVRGIEYEYDKFYPPNWPAQPGFVQLLSCSVTDNRKQDFKCCGFKYRRGKNGPVKRRYVTCDLLKENNTECEQRVGRSDMKRHVKFIHPDLFNLQR